MKEEQEKRLYTDQEIWEKEMKAWLLGWMSRDRVEESSWRDAN